MIKPFKLDNLKSISKRELALTRALYEFLPATDVREKLHVGIRKTLIKHLGQDIRYYVSSVERKRFNEFTVSLPDYPVLAVLGLTPIDKKAIVYIDGNIANVVIDKLLGGGEAAQEEIKPLTETEHGVLQYLLMQILEQIYSSTGAEPRVHFRFEKFISSTDDLAKIADAKDGICVLTMEVSILDRSGFVKLVFPDPFLEGLMQLGHGAGSTKKEREYFARQLEGLGFVKAPLWAEAGNSMLSPLEMNDLEAGDVLLFDETDLSLTGKKIKGEVLIHFGGSERCVAATMVEAAPKKIKCKLGSIVR